MSFKTQRLVNKFPSWTKIRLDKSSLGHRLYSVFGEYFDFATTDLMKHREDRDLLKASLGCGNLWFIDLETEDQLNSTISVSGVVEYEDPTSVITTGDYVGSLTRVETIEELLYPVFTRGNSRSSTSVGNMLIWSSGAPSVFNDIPLNTRLIIKVSNSTEYIKITDFNNRLRSERAVIVLTGLDHDGNEVTEYLDIVDDGRYQTREIFSELREVNYSGFVADIDIYLHESSIGEFIVDRFRTGITPALDGPLKVKVQIEGGETVVTYYASRYLTGNQYRTGSNLVENEEEFWKTTLKDNSGNTITAVDFLISPDDTRLYVLEANGYLHIYDLGMAAFGPPTLESTLTKDIYVDLEALDQFVILNQTSKLFTFHRFIRSPIERVQVKRIDPNGVVNYLQSDRTTWDISEYWFHNVSQPGVLPEDTWGDFSFENLYDVEGQWEFYLTTQALEATTVAYTSVFCQIEEALSSIDLGVVDLLSIKFDHSGLQVGTANEIHDISLSADIYLLDGANRRLYFREEYNSVEVNI